MRSGGSCQWAVLELAVCFLPVMCWWAWMQPGNSRSQVWPLEDEDLVFFLLERGYPQALAVCPVCICWKAFVLGGGFCCLGLPVVGVTLPQGDLWNLKEEDVVNCHSGGAVMHCLLYCDIGVGESKGAQYGKMVQWFPYFRLLLPHELGKFGPSKEVWGGCSEYKEEWQWKGKDLWCEICGRHCGFRALSPVS